MDILVIIISYWWLGITVVSTAIVGFCWTEYYVIYNHNLLYVIGLKFSRSLTYFAVLAVLMRYFTYYEGDLVTSAVMSNIQQALSSILVLVTSNLADSFTGRYQIILLSNTAYIGGLLLMWMFNPYDVKWLLVIILVLLAFGTSGSNLVNNVLTDLVKDIDNSQDEKKSKARAAFWCNIAKASGAVSAAMWVANDSIGGVQASWRTKFLICLIFMTTTDVIFAIGYKVYHQDELIQRPISIILRVCRGRFRKLFKSIRRRLTITSRHDQSTQQTRRTEIEEDSRGFDEHDLVLFLRLWRLVPVWAEFLVVSLALATGSTFFIEQYRNLNTNKIPVQIYPLMQSLSSSAIPSVFRLICPPGYRNAKVKTGVGMFFAVICYMCAWVLESSRLEAVADLDDENENTSISFAWLLPQFCALGCMEGLAKKGLLEFFKSQIKDKKLHKYGKEYIELVLGLGKLLNIALIIILKKTLGWFSHTINDSRLDKYYETLIVASSLNFVLYWFTVDCIITENEQLQNSDSDDSQQSTEA